MPNEPAMVLIDVGEGEIDEMWYGHGLDGLRAAVAKRRQHNIDESRGSPHEESNTRYALECEQAVLAMIASAPTTPGHHVIKPIEPYWGLIVLVVLTDDIEPGFGAPWYGDEPLNR